MRLDSTREGLTRLQNQNSLFDTTEIPARRNARLTPAFAAESR